MSLICDGPCSFFFNATEMALVGRDVLVYTKTWIITPIPFCQKHYSCMLCISRKKKIVFYKICRSIKYIICQDLHEVLNVFIEVIFF